MGLLRQAPVQFEPAAGVPLGGVLWALSALLVEGLLRHSRKRFRLPEGFYPLETIFLVLVFMALVRVRSLEALRYEPPGEWGQLVGLDRIPEVRTLRQKLGQLCQPSGVATTWSSALAQEWMAGQPDADGVYDADGQVRVYHGKLAALPRLHPNLEHKTLTGSLHPLTSRLPDEVVRHLAAELTATATVFPGTDLRLVFTLPGPS